MKLVKKLAALLSALTLICGFSMTVYAAHEVPDLSRTGSITVNMTYGGKAVSGGVLTAYRVGDIAEDDGNYSFAKTSAMAGFSGSYDDLNSEGLAKDVAAYVTKNKLKADATAKNTNGSVTFSDLKLGLYLIVQTKACDGYEAVASFLVSVPANEDGVYVYNIDATPKMGTLTQAKPTPTPTPTKPTGKLPQTGQLNWPVPIMAALGLLLLALGWILYHSPSEKGRRDDAA